MLADFQIDPKANPTEILPTSQIDQHTVIPGEFYHGDSKLIHFSIPGLGLFVTRTHINPSQLSVIRRLINRAVTP